MQFLCFGKTVVLNRSLFLAFNLRATVLLSGLGLFSVRAAVNFKCIIILTGEIVGHSEKVGEPLQSSNQFETLNRYRSVSVHFLRFGIIRQLLR